VATTSTTSVYISKINIAYPVAGQDNDSQGFRDNFTNIQLALSYADSDIASLFRNSVQTTASNDFGNNLIKRAVFQNCSELVADNSSVVQTGNIIIDYSSGSYQKFILANGTASFSIINWPTSGNAGSLLLECVPENAGSASVNFNPTLNVVGNTTAFPDTLSGSTFYKIWTTDNGTTVYITKVGTSNASVATATNITAYQSLTIGTNKFTTSTDLNTVISASGQYGEIALLPNTVTTSINGSTITVPGTNSLFSLNSSVGINVGATTWLSSTGTQFTVTAISGTNVTVTPALGTNWLPSFPSSITFTNPTFSNQPIVTRFSQSPVTSCAGSPGDLKGEIYANSTTLFVSYQNYNQATNNWIKISDDSVPRQLPTGTSATTVNIATSSTVLATTEFVQNLVSTTIYGGIEGALPYGMIMLWYGTIANIPQGWALCDGTNGTPNLTNTFVIGADADTGSTATTSITGSATVTGGSKNSQLIAHNHLAGSIVNDSGHNHTTHFNRTSKSDNATPYMLSDPNVGENLDGSVDLPSSTSTTGITVTTTVLSTGTSNGINENLPPYYALAYIMKVV
jgi:hypothetical protein